MSKDKDIVDIKITLTQVKQEKNNSIKQLNNEIIVKNEIISECEINEKKLM